MHLNVRLHQRKTAILTQKIDNAGSHRLSYASAVIKMKSSEAQPLLSSHGVHVTLVSLPQFPENANVLRPLPSLVDVPVTHGYQVAASVAEGAEFRNDLYISMREASFTSKKPRTFEVRSVVIPVIGIL
jgi:hypothetical protein